jgi:hypothetical protein
MQLTAVDVTAVPEAVAGDEVFVLGGLAWIHHGR